MLRGGSPRRALSYFWGRFLRAGAGVEALGHPVEEPAPAALRRLVPVRGEAAARLLEAHLRAAVAELVEHHGAAVALLAAGLIGDREHEPLRRADLEVAALPADLAAVRPEEHGRAPGPAGPHVHRHGVERDVGVRAAVPVGEALGLGPLAPDALARRLEDPGDREAGLVSHRGAVSHPCDRSRPPRSGGGPRATPPRPRAARRAVATA